MAGFGCTATDLPQNGNKNKKGVPKYRVPQVKPWGRVGSYYSQFVQFAAQDGDIFFTDDGTTPDPLNQNHRYHPGKEHPLNFTGATLTLRVLAFRPGKLTQQKAISAVNTRVINEPVQMCVRLQFFFVFF